MASVRTQWTQETAERWLIEYARGSYAFAYTEQVHNIMREQGWSLPEWKEFLALFNGSEFRQYITE